MHTHGPLGMSSVEGEAGAALGPGKPALTLSFSALPPGPVLPSQFFTCLVILFACEVAAGIWGFVNKDQVSLHLRDGVAGSPPGGQVGAPAVQLVGERGSYLWIMQCSLGLLLGPTC